MTRHADITQLPVMEMINIETEAATICVALPDAAPFRILA